MGGKYSSDTASPAKPPDSGENSNAGPSVESASMFGSLGQLLVALLLLERVGSSSGVESARRPDFQTMVLALTAQAGRPATWSNFRAATIGICGEVSSKYMHMVGRSDGACHESHSCMLPLGD